MKAIQTRVLKQLGISDLRRWKNPSSLSPDWDSRNELIAPLVPPNASVIEFGAGRMVLRGLLPAGCKYTPSDVVGRGPGTLVIDLNARELPAIPPHDVAVFSGVLEYIFDVPRLIKHLSQSVDCIIASYAVADLCPQSSTRRASGWVNDFTARELEDLFGRAGFQTDRALSWRSQKIYSFHRARPERKVAEA